MTDEQIAAWERNLRWEFEEAVKDARAMMRDLEPGNDSIVLKWTKEAFR